MKTPDEIKRGLGCCGENGEDCAVCPYRSYVATCTEVAMRDALAYIQQLEAERKE